MLLFELINHVLFRLKGKDAERYLQGRITQDIKGMKSAESRRSLLLTPQGKIQGQFSIYRDTDSYLILSDPLHDEAAKINFTRALLQFKVADQVELLPVEDLAAAALIGDQVSDKLLFALREAGAKVFLLYLDVWAIVIEPSKAPSITQLLQKKLPELGLGSEAERRAYLIWAGIPEFGAELSEDISGTEIPHQSLISFTKGCYSGQEVVEMSIARGRPNKQLVKFEVSGKHELAAATPLLDAQGQNAGFVSSVTPLLTADRTLGLGFIKTKALETGPFTVNGLSVALRN